MTEDDVSGRTPPDVSDYDLSVDAQVEKFVEIKQKLTYFLISASVVAIAFLVNFVVDNLRVDGQFTTTRLESSLVIASAIAGLATAGLSILTLHLEHRSYALHLGYRYRRQTWESLGEPQQNAWTKITRWAGRLLKGAFVFLFVEIALAVAFFVIFFW